MTSGVQEFIETTTRAIVDPDRLIHALGPARAATLNDGLCGTALTLAVLSDADPALAHAVGRHWDAAARLLKGSTPDGIYRGPGALAASLILGNPYLPAAHRRDTDVENAVGWLSARATGLASHQRDRLQRGDQGTPWAVYDAIKGLAGIGRLLLAADQTGHHDAAEPGINAALTTLSSMIVAPPLPYPGWWLPTHEHHLRTVTPIPASGAATTGLAHGIAGPLAFLAVAAIHGHTVHGQSEAITIAASWLLNWRNGEGSWAPHISGTALRRPNAKPSAKRARHGSWCYGNAGIGNALIHAGAAVEEPRFARSGYDALGAIARKPVGQWQTAGSGICHGTAGVLLVAQTHDHAGLAHQAHRATTALLVNPDRALPDAGPGLLTGRAGTALTLGKADHKGSESFFWTALLLLR
ncbi:lanthionine synthetase LanC family protein [Actinacidiphila yeochonensis]|uniref:lanthionine synthetase LanC family protein n=1 Tax=Actinacidiphila yeochonensis TaxID=89050 RepID=UPI00099D1E06|nr:lanthionine synthetase LanC family protein [Actinacidiphila yeochonensis]